MACEKEQFDVVELMADNKIKDKKVSIWMLNIWMEWLFDLAVHDRICTIIRYSWLL